MVSAVEYLKGKRQDAVLAGARLLGIILAIVHMRLAIVVFAGVYAARVMQRLEGVSLTRDWLRRAMHEDSGHYVFYCLAIYSLPPSLVLLLPVTLNSLLAVIGFLNVMLRETGQPAVLKFPINFIAQRQQSVFQMICNFEVAALFLTVFTLVTSRLAIPALLAFMTMALFHMLRFYSRRNNTNRIFWSQAVFVLDHASTHRYCPAIVARVYHAIKTRVVQYATRIKPQE
ncbi:hypothetical protein PTSG_01698 [Salpingoeca rosetta]|uniref:Uncharacterized protein n=1 Tax=Salpingoeca rosetta (strain ATCC 50818 / BSB-021) TaxID=946362 RepID=F2TYP5_SALR5|nr:uncharacterized protein PTSG_01698 [Salpingoeca rosetta]EGD78719.1 hypothetical protein PTSG_01698 [Salpingoeca rosetta]|eukprot:XP_004997676.1 hypothetical protein PTSG_01698 [Salpingoeca rosetta]